mgnify:CR=1 FL=1
MYQKTMVVRKARERSDPGGREGGEKTADVRSRGAALGDAGGVSLCGLGVDSGGRRVWLRGGGCSEQRVPPETDLRRNPIPQLNHRC